MRRDRAGAAVNIRSAMPVVDTTDAPFLAPPVIVFDLPTPPSVNRMRKLDVTSLHMVSAWKASADRFVLAQRRGQPRKIAGRFELLIVMSEAHTGMDLDNGVKALIDYLRRIDAIQNDDQTRLRRLTVEWGEAPEGCRVHIRGMAHNSNSVSDDPSAGKTLGRIGADAQPGGPDQSVSPVRKARGMVGGAA